MAILIRTFYLLLFLLIGITAARADEIEWKDRSYSHYAEKESLSSILKDLMYGEGMSVAISEKADTDINISLKNLKPKEILRRLASTYQFIWYAYGKVLYVYDITEVQTATLKLVYLSPKVFTDTIKDMGIFDKKFSWNFSNQSRIIRFTGPKKLVNLVMETATMTDTDEENMSSQFVYVWDDEVLKRHYSSTPPANKSLKYQVLNLVSGDVILVNY